MIINHNMNAMNAHRNMGMNTVNSGKSMEKLSSGLRINRAGDDAAGLAISEKMRGQIRGLDQASRNGQDGISMIQTAEGALNETHSILQRMRELGVQGANDTNNEADRGQIQKEMEQLTSELDRIGNTTEFNTKKLLNGETNVKSTVEDNLAGKLNVVGSSDKTKIDAEITITDSTVATAAKVNGIGEALVSNKVVSTDNGKVLEINGVKITLATDDTVDMLNDKLRAAGSDVVLSEDGTSHKLVATSADKGSDAKLAVKLAGTTINQTDGVDASVTIEGKTYTGKGDFVTLDSKAGNAEGLKLEVKEAVTSLTAKNKIKVDSVGANLQIGANEGQNIALSIGDMRAKALGVDSIDVSDAKSSDKSVTTIQKAIDQVSTERSKLGAYQNRLEHTINNLGTASENLSAAESRIRDVDMAKEMMNFSKNNILSQAAQAMLAQANQQPQGVLQLLR
ncbi:flagellin [Clostridium botulinum]|uniref:flagellin N-terminal helical domain-containing protein n=1 Tax=Clostridium botulinum TaxID=1491 RepID=UPI000174E951|nr:flagellin [Clostridium botulinum]ACD53015.1 flagellin [Clostridium botulinum E3 str. Alaska E43]AJF30965.1 flagellin [Clostridium botulinum]AJF34027.1 flagellin [Clostridium botulinum]MBY6790835.1 flagellin [Clostridium botulinum]MBY6818350.1 flagellin [Clostridium botulinum]